MKTIEESFAPIPILTARLYEREMFGLEALGALAEDVFEEAEPLDVMFRGATHDIVKNGEGYDVVFQLPLVEKRSVDLSKKGAELLERVDDHSDPMNYHLACTYARAGETRRALDTLELVVDHGWNHQAWLDRDPDFDSVRTDARFLRIAASIGRR